MGQVDEGTPEQIQDDDHMSDLEDQPVYKGPQTQTCTEALMKANLIMNEYKSLNESQFNNE